jgi:hypothetical protein
MVNPDNPDGIRQNSSARSAKLSILLTILDSKETV